MATESVPVILAAAKALVEPIIGLTVSRPWRGHGLALFLEFGRSRRKYHSGRVRGKAGVMLDPGWRVERHRSIAFSADDTHGKIDSAIRALRGRTVERIEFEGTLPELVIHLDDGWRLRTFGLWRGQPVWALFLPDETWLCVRRGRLYRERGYDPAIENPVLRRSR